MSNFTYTPTASLAITGITPASGPAATAKESASYAASATNSDDRHVETYTINASTTATALDLGKINSGLALWLQVDGPLHVTLTQDLGAGPVDNTIRVEKFILLDSPFSAIQVANPSATTAVRVSVLIPGNRPAVGGGPGVF